MAKVFDVIDDHLRAWIAAQKLFFVGSAPLDAAGHVNVSPKGPIETLSVLDERRVAYLDLVGSGAETAAHIRENGRIVIMLCAFDGPPRIVRLHGVAQLIQADDARFEGLLRRCGLTAPASPESMRAIVLIDVKRIADSCGYGVPLMSCEGRRPHMDAWAAKRLRMGGPNALIDYEREKNALSIDELPAIDVPAPAAEG